MNPANDPRWTAFALGELDRDERDRVRDEIERDPNAGASVEHLRELAALLQECMAEPSSLELSTEERQAILAAEPTDGGLAAQRRRRYLWVGVAAILLLVIGVALWRTGSSGSGGPMTAGKDPLAKLKPNSAELGQKVQIEGQRGTTPAPPAVPRPIVMMDRTGKLVTELAPPAPYGRFSLSPDGKVLAVERAAESGPTDIWLLDTTRPVPLRLTAGGESKSPVWSPDGRFIVFRNPSNGRIYKVESSGGPPMALFAGTPGQSELAFSPDGKWIAFGSGEDIWVVPAEGGVATPLIQTPFREGDIRIAPDGRWMAYTSNESGRREVYVLSFQGATGKWQVSPNGGAAPRWRSDSRELFYLAPDGGLMATEAKEENGRLQLGLPRLLFQAPLPADQFVLSPDGQFILLGSPVTQ